MFRPLHLASPILLTRLCIALLLLTRPPYVASQTVDTQTSDARDFDSLTQLWHQQRSALLTGEIRAKLYRYSDPGARTITRDQLLDIFNSTDLMNPDSLAGMRKKFPAGPWTARFWPATLRVMVDGIKTKNIRDGSDTIVFNGNQEVHYYSDNQQASIHAGRTGLQKVRFEQLCFFPPWDPKPREGFVARKQLNDFYIQLGHDEALIDAPTGFVHKWRRKDSRNNVIQEQLQYGPTAYPGNVIMPSITSDIWYENDHLSFLSILAIEHARLNVDLPPDAFTVPVPNGTTVVDLRKDRTRPDVFVLPFAVPDVLRAADMRTVRDVVSGPRALSWFSLQSAMLGAGILGLLTGTILLRRKLASAK
jgi:hypothetical protein